jgi:hypothetical protein
MGERNERLLAAPHLPQADTFSQRAHLYVSSPQSSRVSHALMRLSGLYISWLYTTAGLYSGRSDSLTRTKRWFRGFSRAALRRARAASTSVNPPHDVATCSVITRDAQWGLVGRSGCIPCGTWM